MTPERLGREIRTALDEAHRSGEVDVGAPADIDVTVPLEPGRGDYTTNAPLRLSKRVGLPAPELARLLQHRLSGVEGIYTVDIAAGGFVNVTITAEAAGDLVRGIVDAEGDYGLPGDTGTLGTGSALRLHGADDTRLAGIQYAHARAARIARTADRVGVHRRDGFDPETLVRRDIAVVGLLGEFRRIAGEAVTDPDRLISYLHRLARAMHDWLDTCCVLPFGDDEIDDRHRTHRWLNDAGKKVVKNGLGMLAIAEPERM